MKKRNWKVMSLLMAGAMLAGSLTGCGSSPSEEGSSGADNSQQSEQSSEEQSEQSSEEQSEQSSEEQSEQPAASGDVVELKWAMVGNGMPSNYDAWKAKLDAYLEEKIGVHLDVEVVKWDDWGNRRSVMVNTNEAFDILFTDAGTYASDVAMGEIGRAHV